MASIGALGEAALRFERCDDVPQGGVICALPALLAVGLLKGVRKFFFWPAGYYPLESIFLSLAFLALARVQSLEALRYQSPGEWGKLLGLDRIPEVKTMREKVALLCAQPQSPASWGNQLAQDWMAAATEHAGFYYIDGHVRVYHGAVAHRPKAYVAREQLCLRATLDYWVNAMDGQPFFVITQDLNELLIKTLKEQILPRLKKEVPNQPTPEELAANSLLHRFVVVFDREGYSPALFAQLEQERIAVITYAKRCKATEDWPVEEFTQKTITLINGQAVMIWMAERGVCLSNDHWVREVRHRDERGHQTALLSTNYIDSMEKVAAALFARWCQENFFRYMMEHYSLDRLAQYGAEPLPETSLVVNPARRALENEIRKEKGLLMRERAQFAAGTFPIKDGQAVVFEQEQGEKLKNLEQRTQKIEQLKERRKSVPRHVAMKELAPEDRFTKLRSVSKHFVDTIKMIAYRAETILLGIVAPNLRRQDDVRSWIRQVLRTSVNLIPNEEQQTLTVQLHPLTNRTHNEALKDLCTQLTDTETVYPLTNLRLIFEFLGPT
jgi:hypothetical protein